MIHRSSFLEHRSHPENKAWLVKVSGMDGISLRRPGLAWCHLPLAAMPCSTTCIKPVQRTCIPDFCSLSTNQATCTQQSILHPATPDKSSVPVFC